MQSVSILVSCTPFSNTICQLKTIPSTKNTKNIYHFALLSAQRDLKSTSTWNNFRSHCVVNRVDNPPRTPFLVGHLSYPEDLYIVSYDACIIRVTLS